MPQIPGDQFATGGNPRFGVIRQLVEGFAVLLVRAHQKASLTEGTVGHFRPEFRRFHHGQRFQFEFPSADAQLSLLLQGIRHLIEEFRPDGAKTHPDACAEFQAAASVRQFTRFRFGFAVEGGKNKKFDSTSVRSVMQFFCQGWGPCRQDPVQCGSQLILVTERK